MYKKEFKMKIDFDIFFFWQQKPFLVIPNK